MTYIIYEDATTVIWYCSIDGEIHQDKKLLTFEEFIRKIDTIPDRSPEWKHDIIQCWAEHFGLQKGVA